MRTVECFHCGEKIRRHVDMAERLWRCFDCRQAVNRKRSNARYIPQPKTKRLVKKTKKEIKPTEDKRYLFFIEAEARMFAREEANEKRLLAGRKALSNGIIGG